MDDSLKKLNQVYIALSKAEEELRLYDARAINTEQAAKVAGWIAKARMMVGIWMDGTQSLP